MKELIAELERAEEALSGASPITVVEVGNRGRAGFGESGSGGSRESNEEA